MKKMILMALSAALVVGMSACAKNAADSAVQMDEKELNSPNAPIVTEEELGLRKENLYTEQTTAPVRAQYTTAAPGSAEKFQRAYENAPPLIPHSVDGLLPITTNNNACLGCHMPDVAKSVGATPIPKTHFMDFRSQKMLDHLAQQRFNCSQCHVPQANVPTLVKNTFEPDFRNPGEKSRSNLIDTLNEGVK